MKRDYFRLSAVLNLLGTFIGGMWDHSELSYHDRMGQKAYIQ